MENKGMMKDSGCCNIMMSRAAKMSATNPKPADMNRVMPSEKMAGTMNRSHASDGRLTGMKKG